jgi:hypothetical protein
MAIIIPNTPAGRRKLWGNGRGDRIRTCDLWTPRPALYQAELRPVVCT